MLYYIILFIIAFAPAAIYAIWIRNTEKYEREPWGAIAIAFLWGASIAIIASLILEIILGISIASSIKDYNIQSFILAVIIAPFAEELTKPMALSLRKVRREINELEDGIIYGAAAGLGFSATENLLYSINFLSYGLVVFIILVSIRTIGGCLLHASATAFTGYGYGKALLYGEGIAKVFPYFIAAMAVHSFYNFVLSFEMIGGLVGVAIALIFAITCIKFVRRKIMELDLKGENHSDKILAPPFL